MLVSVLVLCCVGAALSAPSPGISIRVSQKGLDYAAEKALQKLAGKVKGQHIPDQNGKADVIVGKVEYHLKNMVIQSFSPPSSHLGLQHPAGVQWALAGAGVGLHGDWSYKYRLGLFGIGLSDHGSFDVSVSGASLTASATLGRSSDGRPSIVASGCSCKVKDVSIKFDGGASWLYNIFERQVENPIRHTLQSKLCEAANDAINKDAARELATMKIKVPLMKILVLDYSLVAPPVVIGSYLQLPIKGEIYYKSDPQPPPFTPPALAAAPVSRMVGLSLSDYVLNSAGYALQKHGAIAYNLTRNDLSPNERGMLNVTCQGLALCIGRLIPQLQKFAGGYVEVGLISTTAPRLHMSPGVMAGLFKSQAVINVRMPDNSLNIAFVGVMDATANLTAGISGDKVTAKVTDLKPTFNITKSHVGDISPVGINVLVKVVAMFVMKNLNDLGASGLVLPSLGHAQFLNPTLKLEQNTLDLETDLVYRMA